MSLGLLFIIGAIVFAITVYGAVMAGGVALSHAVDPEDRMEPIVRR